MNRQKVKFWRNISWLNELLRQHRQQSLAEWMNWPSGEVVALELGDAPTIDQLSQLHKTFGVSYQDLIEQDIAIYKQKILSQLTPAPAGLSAQMAPPILEIPLYPHKAGAGSASQIKAVSDHIARICVPKSLFAAFPGESLIAFEIEGYSMHPGIQSGDVVLAAPTEGIEKVQDGHCYLFLLSDSRLLFKRAYHLSSEKRDQGLQLSSDNPDYQDFFIAANDIQQILKFTIR